MRIGKFALIERRDGDAAPSKRSAERSEIVRIFNGAFLMEQGGSELGFRRCDLDTVAI